MLDVEMIEAVWYIEARPWNGPSEGQAGFAQVDPVAMGSGVVVTLELLDEDRNPLADSRTRNYLLTCAHVVRGHDDSLLGDVVCYPPGKGYIRTKENSRRCGTFPNAEARVAKVSGLSPCDASPGPRDEELRRSHARDWVLLEIDDPDFEDAVAVQGWEKHEIEPDQFLQVIGYPAGAGTLAAKETAGEREVHFWNNGHIVNPSSPENFKPKESERRGTINYDGPAEVRAGMSGGGVFVKKGQLVGLHRSSTNAALKREALCVDSIKNWLYKQRRMRPVEMAFAELEESTKPEPDFIPTQIASVPAIKKKNWKMISAVTLGLIAIGIGLGVYLPSSSEQPQAPAPPHVAIPKERIMKIRVCDPGQDSEPGVAGLEIDFKPTGDWEYEVIQKGMTDAAGNAEVKIYIADASGDQTSYRGRFTCKNAQSDVWTEKMPLVLSPYGYVEQIEMRVDNDDEERFNDDYEVFGPKPLIYVRSFQDYGKYLLSKTRTTDQSKPRNLLEYGLTPKVEAAAIHSYIVKENKPLETLARLTPSSLKVSSEITKILKSARVFNQEFKPNYTPLIKRLSTVREAVGLIKREGKSIGSAFIVAPNLMLAEASSFPDKVKLEDYSVSFAALNTNEVQARSAELKLKKIWRGKSENQIVLIEFEGVSAEPLALMGLSLEDLEDTKIVVSGYVFTDDELPSQLNEMIKGREGRLLAMPGMVLGSEDLSSEERGKGKLPRIIHDAYTFRGSIGGPVMNRAEKAVVAIHAGGRWVGTAMENRAVTVKTLLEDEILGPILRAKARIRKPSENLIVRRIDPLNLKNSQAVIKAYDPDFLRSKVPLPTLSEELVQRVKKLDYIHYSIAMDPIRKMPVYAAANSDRSDDFPVPHTRNHWHFDPRLSPKAQIGPEFFKDNHWDHGDLVGRKGVTWGNDQNDAEQANFAVYYWPNVTPQHENFNHGAWKELERRTFDDLVPDAYRYSVFSGPVFDKNDLIERGVKIPQQYWLIAIYEDRNDRNVLKVHAFLSRQYRLNDSRVPEFVPLNGDWTVESTVDEIQKLTGLKFKISSE